HVAQPVEKFVHAVAAERDGAADGHALADLEVRNGLFGPRYDGLLPGDLPELLRGGVQQLHVLAGFAEPDVYRDLLELGNRHAVLPAKALHQRRDRLSPVFFLQSAFHRPLRLIVYLYLSSVALQCRQLRIFEPSGKIVWPTGLCLLQCGQTIITLEALMLPSFSMIPPFTFFEGVGRVWRLMMPHSPQPRYSSCPWPKGPARFFPRPCRRSLLSWSPFGLSLLSVPLFRSAL